MRIGVSTQRAESYGHAYSKAPIESTVTGGGLKHGTEHREECGERRQHQISFRKRVKQTGKNLLVQAKASSSRKRKGLAVTPQSQPKRRKGIWLFFFVCVCDSSGGCSYDGIGGCGYDCVSGCG